MRQAAAAQQQHGQKQAGLLHLGSFLTEARAVAAFIDRERDRNYVTQPSGSGVLPTAAQQSCDAP